MALIYKLYGMLGLRYLRQRFLTPLKVKYHIFKQPSILKRISETKKITIFFFPINLAMWKYDSLLELLCLDDRVRVYIVPALDPNQSKMHNQYLQNEMRRYFRDKGGCFINGYNFETHRYFDAKLLNPDIVVFTQPYNVGHRYFKLEHYWSMSLFVYTPYGMQVENNPHFYNSLLQHIAWKYFCATTLNKIDVVRQSLVKGQNAIVVGSLLSDYFGGCMLDYRNIWKQNNDQIKRVIWAPHHSINADDTLGNSMFLNIADRMLELLDNYEGKVQFAFKPHPFLKKKLYALPAWGVAKTDAYYAKWNNATNSILVDGEYLNLFATSDALIHDCSSFTGEYLYSTHPVMFLSADDHGKQLNAFGRLCYDLHYKGSTIDDIETFINNVLLKDEDVLYCERQKFWQEYLISKDEPVAKKMYKEIISIIE